MMTPIFLNPPNTQYFDLNNQDHHQEDQLQQVLLASSPFCPTIAASSTSIHLDQGLRISATHIMSDQSHAFNDQLEASKNVFSFGESPPYEAQMTNTDNYGSHNRDLFIFKQQEDQEQNNLRGTGGNMTADSNGSSLRWMSSRMRMMRKMINSNGPKIDPRGGSRIITSSTSPDHSPQVGINSDNNNNNHNMIRVCSDCNTTRTPLWRSGPQGPKSLCNACGIRQRKARKAAMEAAAAAATNSSCEASSSTSTKTTIKLMINKDKKKSRATSNTCVSQHSNKKQTPCKQQASQLADSDHNNSSISSSRKQQLSFEEFAVNLLSKNAAFHHMFPQDEEEGALLLMALSCGLIQS
uniref:GATA-type domain-containing protein n=1 Tax=Kalanchoe fedtschenkoi TaxID=63787 RepID=A0A7N1A8R0_KALFE